jgi:dipeptidyl-peptidase-4
MKITNLFYPLVITGLLFHFFAASQEKMLTLQDAVYMNPEILPKTMRQLKWIKESDNYSFVKNNMLLKCSAVSGATDTLVTLDDLNTGFADIDLDSLKRFPDIQFIDEFRIRFFEKNKLFLYNITSGNLTYINYYYDGAGNIDICDKNNMIAYTLENNLYVSNNNEQIQVTKEDNKGIVYGQIVHRNEFGINKGTFWSPEGNFLAFYRKDETMVADYPLVDIEAREAEVKNIKYPMAGMTSEQVTLGIFDFKSRTTQFIRTGDPRDQYLTSVTWDPSEAYIYIGLLNREQNHLTLNKYSISTGELVYTLFEEQDKNYVEPEHPMYFLDSRPNQFIWFSERDEFQHLYLYSTSGHMIQQLTAGEWVVTDYLATDVKEKFVYFLATKDSPIQQNIYSVELKTGKISRISKDHGTHNAVISYSGQYIIDSYSSLEIAKEYKLYNSNGNLIRILQKNIDPLSDYKLGTTNVFSIFSDDSTELYCRLIKPADFDSSKKYPVFFYVYGGPHSQLVNDSWLGAAGIFQNYMAQQGYVVFTMDNRGTAHRGLEFEQAVFRKLGTVEVADQMKGVDYLKSLDFVDADRIGLDGWSYGGFLSLSLMLKNPGVFKSATAGGPVIDWKYYEVMYGERYMDTPKENPEGYKNACLLNYASQLQDKLLIFHGTVDETVVWQNSLSFIKKCVDEGKQVEYFVYPGHEHNVRGKDRIYLYQKIRDFANENLKN